MIEKRELTEKARKHLKLTLAREDVFKEWNNKDEAISIITYIVSHLEDALKSFSALDVNLQNRHIECAKRDFSDASDDELLNEAALGYYCIGSDMLV